MTLKKSDSVTVTLKRSTVERLRWMKGSETWDELMLRLSKRQRCGIQCKMCGGWIDTKDSKISCGRLAKLNRWKGLGNEYVCPACSVSLIRGPKERKEG